MPIASLTTSEAEVKMMGADVGRGHITAASYFQSVASASNDAFVRRYKKRFGNDEPTNLCVEAAYFQVHVFAKALAEVNTLHTEVLRPIVLHCEFDAPQGHVAIDSESSHTNLWTRSGRVNEHGQFDLIRERPRLSCPIPIS